MPSAVFVLQTNSSLVEPLRGLIAEILSEARGAEWRRSNICFAERHFPDPNHEDTA